MKVGDVIKQRYQRGAAWRTIIAFTHNSCAVTIEGLMPVQGEPRYEIRCVSTWSHDVVMEDGITAERAKLLMQHPDVQRQLLKWLFNQYV